MTEATTDPVQTISFEGLTQPQRIDEGQFQFDLKEETSFWSVNGGYLAAICLRAAASASQRSFPLSVATDFLRPVRVGAAMVSIRVLHQTSKADLIEACVSQEGKLRAVSRIWLADGQSGPTHLQARMPHVPHPEELKTREEYSVRAVPPLAPFWQVFDQRPINRVPENRGRLVNEPRFLRWFRYLGGGACDSPFLSLARTLPIIDMHGAVSAAQMYDKNIFQGTSPTAQLTVQFRQVDYTGEWLLCDAICEYAANGVTSTDVKIWGSRGELLAQGISQMLARPMPGSA